ncbi:MAG: hypothetical protein IJF96_02660 [Firmicutes bacterium]|nr:hypothetical protein [Bacillota bacterium]
MAKNEFFQFYVEGEDEKKVIDTLKKDMKTIVSGKVDVLNVIQKEIKSPRIRTLKTGTNVILVYDTDIERTDILEKNIRLLQSSKHIKRIICIPQVKNLEEELVRATNVRRALDILGSRSLADFKRDLIKCTNLDRKLQERGFDMSKFWCKTPHNSFAKYGNDAELIKKLNGKKHI